MTRATKEAYVAMLEQMRTIIEFNNLKVVMSDFECPQRKAISLVFPDVKITGCNVHFDRVITINLYYSGSCM